MSGDPTNGPSRRSFLAGLVLASTMRGHAFASGYSPLPKAIVRVLAVATGPRFATLPSDLVGKRVREVIEQLDGTLAAQHVLETWGPAADAGADHARRCPTCGGIVATLLVGMEDAPSQPRPSGVRVNGAELRLGPQGQLLNVDPSGWVWLKDGRVVAVGADGAPVVLGP